MYAQVCMHLDITYIIGMLGRYLSNLGMDHYRLINNHVAFSKNKRLHTHLQAIKLVRDH